MPLSPAEAAPILRRTPAALDALLRDLPEPWIRGDRGPGTWSPFDIVGHLCHGERTDWIPRARRILEHGPAVPFEPFDREAMKTLDAGKPLAQVLDEFAALRAGNLEALEALRLREEDLAREGLHPALGRVTLGQLLATWVAHDLDHLGQIARTLAHRHRDAVGPWRAYLPILGR
jgi:hypothetical protein